MMRVVVLGNVQFTNRCLMGLHGDPRIGTHYVLAGVITGRPPGSGADYERAAAEPVATLFTRSANGDLAISFLRALKTDLLLVLGWSEMLSPEVLAIPRLGAIGSHPSPLPIGRGRHPLINTILQGWTPTLTLFQLGPEADAGDIWLQREFEIDPDDHATEAYESMCRLGARMVPDLLAGIAAGTLTPHPQDHAKATVMPRRTEEDGVIRLDGTVEEAYRLVRALADPYPGAVLLLPGMGPFRCRRAGIARKYSGEAYPIHFRDGTLNVYGRIA